MTAPERTYVFDTAGDQERDRLNAHSRIWDDFTCRTLADTGVGAGWRCLEIGAGTGTVASWLVDQVGPHGQVVATDIETRWLEPLAGANLVVRHHNVADDHVDEQGYDLVHARLVLEHLPQRDAVTAKLVAALRPGGWLVVEDYDVRPMAHTMPARPAWAAVNAAIIDVLRSAGADPLYGAELGGLLERAGLVDVAVEGFLRQLPLPELAPAFRPILDSLRRPLVASGAVDDHEVADALAAFDGKTSPAVGYTPALIAATGRRP